MRLRQQEDVKPVPVKREREDSEEDDDDDVPLSARYFHSLCLASIFTHDLITLGFNSEILLLLKNDLLQTLIFKK